MEDARRKDRINASRWPLEDLSPWNDSGDGLWKALSWERQSEPKKFTWTSEGRGARGRQRGQEEVFRQGMVRPGLGAEAKGIEKRTM